MSGETVAAARGRWRAILIEIGIGADFLVNRHGPCPLCGGRDRFRWDDKDGSGSYYCNQCGPGSGILMVRKYCGLNYSEACTKVDEVLGRCGPAKGAHAHHSDEPARRRAKIEALLDGARSPGVVGTYLASRGLSTVPACLRGHDSVPYVENGAFRGRFPAVIAPIVGPNGDLQSAHRIYVGDVPGARKKVMPPVETITGGAVRLFAPTDTLGIAEGVETAIAAHELFGVPTWAAISANGLERFTPPAGLRHLVVFGDDDASFAGQAAAYSLASRLRRDRPDLGVIVRIPEEADTDWLDVLNAGGAS